jgi:hypothetical protein
MVISYQLSVVGFGPSTALRVIKWKLAFVIGVAIESD